MIIFQEEQIKALFAYCIRGLPNECCGLLAGTIKDGVKTVTKVFYLKNIDQSPEHFSMDMKEQFRVISQIRKNNFALLGNFHSHPATPSRPSAEDIRLAFDPSLSYVIISLQDKENPVINSFYINDQVVEKEELQIVK
ncbi:MAG: MPN domain-containing protein [Lachnoclostridium sp.]|jgi:[CysO sulfur-carrier protein]-S-L-cysteine hydrolase